MTRMSWVQELPGSLLWPATLVLAWWLGEWIHARTRIPRISAYGLVGFALAGTQAGVLPTIPGEGVLLAAHVALGLILFEFGYRISLRWIWLNPWLLVIALVESMAIFGALMFIGDWSGLDRTATLLVAVLGMASSPAILLRVMVSENCRGQVTDRALHVSALTTLLAILAFKALLGVAVMEQSGDWRMALWLSVVSVVLATLLGGLAALFMRAVTVTLSRTGADLTLGFATAVMCLVSLATALDVSPIVAAMTFGIASRQLRLYPGHIQQGFGSLGELAAVLLFVLAGSLVSLDHLVAGALIGGLLIVVRIVIRIGVNVALAPPSGISLARGALVGLAMTPLSAMVLLLLEQTRRSGVDLISASAPLATAVFVLEVLGPIVTLLALSWAREARDHERR
jgi:Kef-type K+ transport system membrane component KefB